MMLRIEIEALQNADYDLNILGFEDEELTKLGLRPTRCIGASVGLA